MNHQDTRRLSGSALTSHKFSRLPARAIVLAAAAVMAASLAGVPAAAHAAAAAKTALNCPPPISMAKDVGPGGC